MKKFLPKTKNNSSGFTLIELMVVISIIAFLSVIGITAFTNAQKTARDGRRRGDIDAIVKAMESNYNPIAGTYSANSASFYSNNNLPSDPSDSTNTYSPTLVDSNKGFWVCATLENTTQGNSSGVTVNAGPPFSMVLATADSTRYCRISQQSQ